MNTYKLGGRGHLFGQAAVVFILIVCSTGTATARETAVAISAGNNHTCAINADGGVECWGDNSYGQIGNGISGWGLHQVTPARVKGLTTGVLAISAGYEHTCAMVLHSRANRQGVQCWGDNQSGQLGDGTTKNSPTPVVVSELAALRKVAVGAGAYFTCAIVMGTRSGARGVKCWGENSSGQLGEGATGEKTNPVDVLGLQSGVASLSVGERHSCAVTDAGALVCWGDNYYGQIGNGTVGNATAPFQVFASGIKAVAAGSTSTCALTIQSGVMCWGDNSFGQLGNGTIVAHHKPTHVSGLNKGVSAIAGGGYHNCAIIERSGRVVCWGRDTAGEVGDDPGPTHDYTSTAVPVVRLGAGIAAVDLGGMHSCALLAQPGSIKCWGLDNSGQIGDGTGALGSHKLLPTRVRGF